MFSLLLNINYLPFVKVVVYTNQKVLHWQLYSLDTTTSGKLHKMTYATQVLDM